MSNKGYSSDQSLNDWVAMLHSIYGASQNYAKSSFEIHAHLAEVCGVFAKHLFKRGDFTSAVKFLPRIFSWCVALLKKIRPDENDLEGIILKKFPNACPYCTGQPCICWKGETPTLDSNKLRNLYYKNRGSQRWSANDFQLMFQRIYGDTWVLKEEVKGRPQAQLHYSFIRLIEELAELAEAVRFNHLYPDNFENELADFIAWWFAIVSCMSVSPESNGFLAEEILWGAYPGHCPDCKMIPCFCRPGPVRELMSKPPPGQSQRFDGLTAVYNQAAYIQDLDGVEDGTLVIAMPVGCVRIDIDDFKAVNDRHGHPAGDAALRHVTSILRKKVDVRDRVFRISGDEFGVLLMDSTEEEGAGVMKRVSSELRLTPVRWVSSDGTVSEFNVSISVGVAECNEPEQIKQSFEQADQASYASKAAGKGMVTRASTLNASGT